MNRAGSFEEIQSYLLEHGVAATDPSARELVRAALNPGEPVLEEFFGDGPLKALLADPDVTEILVNGPDAIWFEREGVLSKTDLRFSSEESLRRYARRLLSGAGRKIDQLSPFSDCIAGNGTRVHVAIPPVAKNGYCLSIRKPRTGGWTLDSLFERGFLDQGQMAYLREALSARKNLFLCGGTGSGKTSLLGALVSEVSPQQRLICLEDVAEVSSVHPHFLTLEARPANQEGEGEQSLRRLLREALRMRPDRLIIGECRGPEALDLLMALNTGHSGSMGTIHANSPRDALGRLEMLALLGAENLSDRAVKSLIASSVHVIIHIERSRGARKIASISELAGVDGGTYLLREARIQGS